MADVLHALHVLGAVFAVGPLAIIPMLGLRAIRQRDQKQLLGLARSTVVFTVVSALVIVLGFGVMSTYDDRDEVGFTTTWILWSFVFSAVAVALQAAVTAPALSRAARTTDAPRRDPYLLVAASSGVSALLLVVTVLLMVVQPV